MYFVLGTWHFKLGTLHFLLMLVVQNKIVEDRVLREQFVCNLNACKGACCWEGDYGAPVDEEERRTLDRIYETVKPYLTEEGRAVIETQGTSIYFEKAKEYGTPLLANEACAYLTTDANGIAKCGIERAFEDGKIDFHKPISCHLYPVRIAHDRLTNMETLAYDEWDICSAACALGKSLQMPVYRFVKNALVRKYGADFYEELEAGAKHLAG